MQNIAICSLTDAFTLLVTLRPRLVTWGHCHSTQESVANVPASWEGKGAHVFQPREQHCNVFFERYPQFASVFATQVGEVGSFHGTQERVSVVWLYALKVLPRFGSTLWVSPADLRWKHNKIQRLFTGGQSLQDVAAHDWHR